MGAHTKSDLKVHLVWIPKYRKQVLTGEVAIRARDLIRQIAMQHELEIIESDRATELATKVKSVRAVHNNLTIASH